MARMGRGMAPAAAPAGAAVLVHAERRRGAADLGRPLPQNALGAHDERRRRAGGGGGEARRRRSGQNQGDELDGLAEAHVVGQDAAVRRGSHLARRHPGHRRALVREEFDGQARRRIERGGIAPQVVIARAEVLV